MTILKDEINSNFGLSIEHSKELSKASLLIAQKISFYCRLENRVVVVVVVFVVVVTQALS